jgi:hypothetical protein
MAQELSLKVCNVLSDAHTICAGTFAFLISLLFYFVAKTIIPNETVFDNVDWIIGNHADELAPWIPIMAMRSNPWTKYVPRLGRMTLNPLLTYNNAY